MEHIGTRIKRLRRERDLTQEKLANYLNVSFQAVSKWETGTAEPNISMLAPLAKLLNVTTDELLGLTVEDVDERKKELEDALKVTWRTGNLKDRYDVCVAAVAEYPGDMKWLNKLAWTEAMLSFDYEDEETCNAERDKAIRKFASVIEECEDPKIRNSAIKGIVQYLTFSERRDEAKEYAELYPSDDVEGRREVMNYVLTGEEKLRFEQESVERKLDDFVSAVYSNFMLGHYPWDIPLAPDLILKTLELVFPDGNYLLYHNIIGEAHLSKAIVLTSGGKYDEAIDELKKSRYHFMEHDKIDFVGNTEVLHYTAPLFDRLSVNPSKICRSGEGTLTDSFIDRLKAKEVFIPLRERKDFKELFFLKPLSQE